MEQGKTGRVATNSTPQHRKPDKRKRHRQATTIGIYPVDRFNLRKLADKQNTTLLVALHRAIVAECKKNAIEPLRHSS